MKNGQGKILNLFFQNPDEKYYVRQIARIIEQDLSKTRRSLLVLLNSKFLLDEYTDGNRYFKLNKNHPLLEEVKAILSKTLGIEAKIKELIDSLENTEAIEVALIYGSIAKKSESIDSDVDLLIIGDGINQSNLLKKVPAFELELNRKINYQVYSPDEFKRKVENRNPFITNILNEPHIIIKQSEWMKSLTD
ncbi:nucleotidyltransferase domain-containing protein [Candidatus Parcubacteria bacterium]|nr:nucleotidyltransferase domain-containing protein [Candidatus Parcubacteria bacterium]